jgi:hypothetical protein
MPKKRPYTKKLPIACTFNATNNDNMDMATLVDKLRSQVGGPRTPIRVVTALIGSTSPAPTLILLMPEITYVATAVYNKKWASPPLVSSCQSPQHVYLSLPAANTGPLCLRHVGLCPQLHRPHVLMCDKMMFDTMLPDIATRLVVAILCDHGVLFQSCFSHPPYASPATHIVHLRWIMCILTCRNS